MGQYKMRIDLSVLNHLGINLYSNYSAVLSEAIANSWDADATLIQIHIDVDQDKITIEDNGTGMDSNDLNDKYLRVGYSKRITEGDKSKKGRPLMGRKGIGKLSLFSVAKKIEVHSKKVLKQAVAIMLNLSDIESCAEKREDYEPNIINPSFNIESGTKLILTELNLKRAQATVTSLKKRIARRFSIIGTADFNVRINDEEISQKDREDLTSIEYIWTFGGYCCNNSSVKNVLDLDNVINKRNSETKISGWIGTSHKPSQLSIDESFNLNSIVVLARGRLIQENILQAINDGRVYTKYVTGAINADFIDLTTSDDIATSDRQRIIEDDDRYKELLQRIRLALQHIGNQWTELRKKDGIAKVSKEIPEIREWLETFTGDTKKSAEDIIGTINTLTFDDENKKREVYKYSILAFERLRLRDELSILPSIIEKSDIECLLKTFCRIDDIEAALYHDITKGRLAVVNELVKLKESDVKEKVLQKHLFEHLWLLDPSWERNDQIPPEMEKSINKIFKIITDSLTPEEQNGRIDIQFRKTSGDYVIIELKRFSVKPKIYELMDQGRKYISGVQKHLNEINDRSPILMIYVLGYFPEDEEKNKIYQLLNVKQSKIVTYNELVINSQKAYSEYIKQHKNLDIINELISKI